MNNTEIEKLRTHNTRLYKELTNERIARFSVEAELQAETERCAKIARDYQLSPVVGRAIAALIVNKAERN